MIEINSLKDLEGENHRHNHEDFDHYIFQTDKELDYSKFEEFIKMLPKEVIRAKGFINFSNAPHKDKKYLLQYVVNRKDYKVVDWDENKSSAILFVGKELDKEKIKKELEECLIN